LIVNKMKIHCHHFVLEQGKCDQSNLCNTQQIANFT